MKVMGIDPGTIVTGYGVVDRDDTEVSLVDYGTLRCKASSSVAVRLSVLYDGMIEVIERYGPDVVAVEQPFVAKNTRSAFAIGKAQAVAILAAAKRDIPVYEYTPAQVKQRVANYGASSKEQIQEMVRIQLGLSCIPAPSDAADALAIALCHIGEFHLQSLITKG